MQMQNKTSWTGKSTIYKRVLINLLNYNLNYVRLLKVHHVHFVYEIQMDFVLLKIHDDLFLKNWIIIGKTSTV